MDCLVLQEDREERQAGGRPGDNDRRPGPPGTACRAEVREPQRDENAAEQHHVAVRQRLEQPGHAKERQPPDRAPLQIAVEAEQDQRDPARGNHLEMAELRQPIRRESVRCARKDRRIVSTRDEPDEEKCRERRQRPRQEENEVVGREWIARDPVDRGRDRREALQVFGERADVASGIEVRRIPPRRAERNRLRVPPEDRRVQDGVVRIARNVIGAVRQQRPGVGTRQDQIQAEDGGDAKGTSHPTTLACGGRPVSLHIRLCVRASVSRAARGTSPLHLASGSASIPSDSATRSAPPRCAGRARGQCAGPRCRTPTHRP